MVQSYVSGDTALNDGKWHLITGVRNVSTDKVSIYVDGRLNQELPDDTISSMKNDDDISIGNSGASYNEYDFTGMIDDVRIYNYARTPAQIQWDYNRGKPMAWYKFDENTGSTTYDSSGNGYTNDALNGATYTTGKYSYALNFDGTNDYVTIPDTSSAGIDVGDTTSSYSVSAWFKTSTNFSASATLVAKDNGSGVYPYALQINSSEQPCLVMNDGSTRTLCGSSNVSDGSWHLMTAVRDVSADTLTLYIDGQRVNYMTDPTTATMQNNDKTSIGCSGTSYSANDYTGQIDDVQIYNYPLTATQVKLLYNQNSTARF